MPCDIDIATGEVFQRRVDVDIPGLFPIEFSRRYSVFAAEDGGVLGYGWRHSVDVWVEADDVGVVLHDGLNDPRSFPWDQCDGVKGPAVDHQAHRLSLTFPDRSEWVFRHVDAGDARLNLVSRRDAWGNTLTRTYDRGQLVSIVDPQHRHVRLHYGRGQFLEQITIAHDVYQRTPVLLVRYDIDHEGNLVAATDAAGQTESYQYVDHVLVAHTNRIGGTVHYAYDRDRRCRRSWYADGTRVRALDYDTKGRRTLLTDSYGFRMLQVTDEGARIVRQIDPLGHEREVVYDDGGRFIAMTDEFGVVGETEFYNPTTRELRSATATADAGAAEFDEVGRVVRRSTAGSWSLGFGYDLAGQLTAISLGDTYSATFEYDRQGRTVAVAGSDGYVVRQEYADDGFRRRLVDADGVLEEQVFDIVGNLASHRDARGAVTVFEYAGQDVPAVERLDDGRRIVYEADGEGNTVAVHDPAGNTRRIGVDAFGNLVDDVDPLGHAERYEYDAEHRLSAIVNKKGDRFELQYDAVGNEIVRRFFEGDVRYADHDARGRRTRVTDADGATRSLAYDADDNVVRQTLSDGWVQTFSYDAVGRVTDIVAERKVDGVTQTDSLVLQYDSNDEVIREELPGHWIEHDYDPLHHVVAVRDSWGGETTYRRGTRYHLEAVEEHGRRFEIRLDGAGFLQEIGLPNGMTQLFDIDPYGRLLQRDVRRSDGTTLASRSFRYDTANRLIGVADTSEGTVLYDYDRRGRLTSVSTEAGAVLERYGYDANDNLISTDAGAIAIGAGDQVAGAGGWRYEYDVRGQLTRRVRAGEDWNFDWDGDGHLSRVTRDGAAVAAYAYDLLGRRTRKVTAEGEVTFIYDEFWNLRAERRGETTVRYVYLPGIDVPIACRVGEAWYFYSFDQLGMPTEVWNEEGMVMCRVRKDAYGRRREMRYTTDVRPPMPFVFPGQYYDAETGLCYNMFRYYDPETASYVSRDPLSILARSNHYAYPRDPLCWMDPDGLAQLTFHCKDTPKCKWGSMDCAKHVARLKLEQYRRDAAAGFRKCSGCDRTKQRDYYKDKCGGSPPDSHQVDHLHDLQAGGADKCCKNLVAIPKEINNCLGSVVRRMLREVGTRCNAGTTISMIGCSGGKCKNPANAYIRPPKRTCADDTPKC